MRLFHFIEQEDAMGPAVERPAESAGIAGVFADEAHEGVLPGVFGKVEAKDVAGAEEMVAAEEDQLGLAGPGGADQQEGAAGAAGGGKPQFAAMEGGGGQGRTWSVRGAGCASALESTEAQELGGGESRDCHVGRGLRDVGWRVWTMTASFSRGGAACEGADENAEARLIRP